MLARVARYEVEAERIDDAVRVFGEAATAVEGLAGFAGGFVFVDQEDGRTMTVTFWDNTVALENSEPTAGRARRSAAEAVGAPCCRSRSSRLRTSSAREASSATPRPQPTLPSPAPARQPPRCSAPGVRLAARPQRSKASATVQS